MTELERRLLAKIEEMTQERIRENVELREMLQDLTTRLNGLVGQVETLNGLLQRMAGQ